ncbi:MAG: hypothetical protein HZA50_08450 [Planctomycetes bacterium]|nr:hypothetical protein [Planctomycetota bacterium]
MSDQMQDKPQQQNAETPADDFLSEASKGSPGFFSELFSFLMHNKKWWLAPIIIVLLLFGLLLILAASGAAPFIYTLF